ncbi:hypothetical protein AB4Y85_16130 [Microvirga sp. 2YAF29]|uniref:hypothetical protein n=1 Tax=Microvirga sp. 2YAF29 TaxID=3233031 RepID=UPI003F96532E
MSDTEDLLAIATEIANLEPKFFQSLGGPRFVRPDDERRVSALVVEATAIMKEHLGPLNDFSFAIADAARMNDVGDIEQQIRAAARHIKRKERSERLAPTPIPLSGSIPHHAPYVSPLRIAEIEALKGGGWDFAKLARLCNELNVAHSSDCYFATAMLIRAITDHVPPVFGMTSFTQVASNYSGSQSFKKSMQHLQGSLRNIADGILHEQIRSKESLPSPQQVDFRQDLDRLMGEIVRITSQV